MVKKEHPEYIKECFEINKGIVFWKKRPRSHFKNNQVYSMWNNRYPGNEAGFKGKSGDYEYTCMKVGLNGKTYPLGHIAWVLHYGEWPKYNVDHLDGITRNNSKDNLRDVPASINNKNRKLHRNNTSGYTGVSFCKSSRKYVAFISIDGKLKRLGLFDNIEDAIDARKLAMMLDSDYTERHGR